MSSINMKLIFLKRNMSAAARQTAEWEIDKVPGASASIASLRKRASEAVSAVSVFNR